MTYNMTELAYQAVNDRDVAYTDAAATAMAAIATTDPNYDATIGEFGLVATPFEKAKKNIYVFANTTSADIVLYVRQGTHNVVCDGDLALTVPANGAIHFQLNEGKYMKLEDSFAYNGKIVFTAGVTGLTGKALYIRGA